MNATPVNDNTRYAERRARKAKFIALRAYDKDCLETSITDLLADVLHLCHSEGFNFPDLFERAAYHYEAEKRGM